MVELLLTTLAHNTDLKTKGTVVEPITPWFCHALRQCHVHEYSPIFAFAPGEEPTGSLADTVTSAGGQ